MSEVFRPYTANVTDRVSLQRHVDGVNTALRKLGTGGATTDASTNHTVPDLAAVKTALDALGTKINAILDKLV